MSDEITLADFRNNLIADIKASVAEPVLYDLGCGQSPEEDFIGLDLFSKGERIRQCDLYTFPWRVFEVDGQWSVIPDASVDCLAATHFLEHVPDFMAHFVEAYRVLKPGGFYKLISPYYLSVRAFQDPDHKQPISEQRLLYLNQEWVRKVKREHYGPQVNFEVWRGQFFYAWNADFIGKTDEVRGEALKHQFNVADDIALILQKLPMPEEA